MKQIRMMAVLLLFAAVLAAAAPTLAQTPVMEITGGQTYLKPDGSGNAILNADAGTAGDDYAELRLRKGTTQQWSFGLFAGAYYAYNYQVNQYGMNISSVNNVSFNCRTNSDDLTIGSGSNDCKAGTYSTINAGSTAFTASSSRTIKENLQPVAVDGLLDKIAATEVYSYDFIDGPKDAIGVMAEDFHQIFGRGSDKMLSGHEMQVALWLAVQELTAQNNSLKEQNQALNQRLSGLESRLGQK